MLYEVITFYPLRREPMKPFELEKAKLLQAFRTEESGLGSDDVRRRQAEFGANIIEQKAKKNYLKEYFLQYIQFFPILLEIAGILAFVAEVYQPGRITSYNVCYTKLLRSKS